MKVMVHFRHHKKIPERLAWSRLCTDRGQIEPTSVFHATTDACQNSSGSVELPFGEMTAKKPIFGS